MQLTQQETVSAFLAGAKKGLVRSFGYIAAVGGLIGVGLLTGIIGPGVIPWGAAILTALSTAVTVGMFSGQQSLSDYHQKKHNDMYAAKIAQLEGRDREILNAIGDDDQHLVHAPKISTILQEGAKEMDRSFAEKEEGRINAPSSRTLH